MIRCTLLSLALVCTLAATPARAITFTIDPTQSSLEVFLSLDLPDGTRIIQQQAPGSLTTHVTGTIDVDLSLPGHFLALAQFELGTQPGNFAPFDQPANWAGLLADYDAPGSHVMLAARDVASTANTLGWTPLSAAGEFDPQQVIAAFQFGTLDMHFPGVDPTSLPMNLLNLAATNQSLDVGLLHQVGPNTLEFRLPIYSRYRNNFIDTIVTGLEGQIVAYATVPEPVTGLPLALGALACLWHARRRWFARRRAG